MPENHPFIFAQDFKFVPVLGPGTPLRSRRRRHNIVDNSLHKDLFMLHVCVCMYARDFFEHFVVGVVVVVVLQAHVVNFLYVSPHLRVFFLSCGMVLWVSVVTQCSSP